MYSCKRTVSAMFIISKNDHIQWKQYNAHSFSIDSSNLAILKYASNILIL